jgi:AraC-like DNA-binding protein
MQFFKIYQPPDPLKELVREIQILHMNWEKGEDLPPPYITCLANTEQNLYLYPYDPIRIVPNPDHEGIPVSTSIVTGPKTIPVGLKFGKDYLMIKVAFYPTGLYRLLKIPMRQTANTGLDAEKFWGTDIKLIIDLLRNASTYDEMTDITCEFLLKQSRDHVMAEEPIDRVVKEMIDPGMKLSLSDWASKACLSLRQFERKFIERVGISPKLFVRIVRFENSMKLKNDFKEKSWSEVALECDYTDSSHMLREFRQFAEFAPGSLFQFQTSGFGDFPTG